MTTFDRSAATKLVEEARVCAEVLAPFYDSSPRGVADLLGDLSTSLASAVEYIGELERDLASMKVQRDTARLTSMNWENGYSGLEAEVTRLNKVLADVFIAMNAKDSAAVLAAEVTEAVDDTEAKEH